MEGQPGSQVLNTLNGIFSRDSLRRNVYIFNALNPYMELPLRIIAQQRRIANLVSNSEDLLQAIQQCPYLKIITPKTIKVIMKGDPLLLSLKSQKKLTLKELHSFAKKIKCDMREETDGWQVQFHSHAAMFEFMERVKESLKVDDKNHVEMVLKEKDAYECLNEAITNLKREKKKGADRDYYVQQEYQNTQYPIFIRKAVESEDEYVDQIDNLSL